MDEKLKYVNDDLCVVVQLLGQDSKVAVGFRNWFEKYLTEDQIYDVIETAEVVAMYWPKCEILPAKKMLKSLENLGPNEWTKNSVKILSCGNWIKMFQVLHDFDKINKAANKSKKADNEQSPCNTKTHPEVTSAVSRKRVQKETAMDGSNNSVIENQTISKDKSKKKRKKRRKEPIDSDDLLSSADNVETVMSPVDESEFNQQLKSQGKNVKKGDNSHDLHESPEAELPSSKVHKKKKDKKSDDPKDSNEAPKLSEAELSSSEVPVKNKKKKKKKNKDKEQESSTEDVITSLDDPKTPEMKVKEKKKKRKQVSSDTDAVTEVESDGDGVKVIEKKRKTNDYSKFDLMSGEQSTFKVDKERESISRINDEAAKVVKTTAMVHVEQQMSSNKQNTTKSDKKSTDLARKLQIKKTGATIVDNIKTRLKEPIIINSDSELYEESVSSDEPPRKRSKKQLESDISVLLFENKNLKNEVSVYRNSQKAVQASQTVMDNLKESQKYLRKLKFSCPNCNFSDALKDLSGFQSLSSFNHPASSAGLPSNPFLRKSLPEKVDMQPCLVEGNKVPNAVKGLEVSPKNIFLPKNSVKPIDFYNDRRSTSPTYPANDFVPNGENETHDENGENLNSTNIAKKTVPMTDLGHDVAIATSVIEKFRKGELRHYLLDMANAVYSPIEFFTCSKSGKKKGSVEIKVLDPTKKQAIIDYTETIFTGCSKTEIEKKLTAVLTNKCKNARQTTTKPAPIPEV